LEVIGIPTAGSWTKRCFDLFLAIIGVSGSAPVWGLISFLVWFEDPGPILFVKNSVGKGGRNFHQYKFRTMVRGAEVNTGPVLSREGDDRVLLVGRLLRKTALDELPQVINILKGEMSFVGPRPQRTVLVHDYLAAMPEYAERHRVLPGLSGLAQVAGDYYLTPRQKLRFDRLYIQNLSLGNDVKLLFLACLITFWFRWRKGWTGRLPRRLLKLGVSEDRFSQ
jgi:lipopolysaccharide/colanic/teichoic acid biosynthesis glycosyltransferase